MLSTIYPSCWTSPSGSPDPVYRKYVSIICSRRRASRTLVIGGFRMVARAVSNRSALRTRNGGESKKASFFEASSPLNSNSLMCNMEIEGAAATVNLALHQPSQRPHVGCAAGNAAVSGATFRHGGEGLLVRRQQTLAVFLTQFKQMGGAAVTQRMVAAAMAHPAVVDRRLDCGLHAAPVHGGGRRLHALRPAARVRKQQLRMTMGAPEPMQEPPARVFSGSVTERSLSPLPPRMCTRSRVASICSCNPSFKRKPKL